jgi:hypothetical protein
MQGNWSRGFSLRFAASALGGALMLFCAGIAGAQAPPGPISGAPPAASDQPVGRPAPPPNNRWKNPDKPNLAGAWRLNQDESDDPRQRAQQSRGNSGGGGGVGGQHGGWGVGGPGGVGVYHGGGGRSQQAQDQASSMMEEFSQLTIEQTDATVRVKDSGNQLVAQFPMNSDTSNDKDAKNNSSQWQSGQLVVVTQGKHGGKITRRYTLSADGDQLYVTTRIDKSGSDQPVMFRFVYDLVRNNAQER